LQLIRRPLDGHRYCGAENQGDRDMTAKKIVKLSNILCIISVIALCYWVFTFIVMNVFGLKVFRKNLTETFYLSILGILALMFGALITNIMFNLTRIAEKHNSDTTDLKQTNKIILICFIALFPIITILLFAGDYLTANKKERMLVQSAESIVVSNKNIIDEIINYDFTKKWISNASTKLQLLSKMDRNYKNISILVSDSIDNVPVFLIFNSYDYTTKDSQHEPDKVNFVFQSDIKQREYLEKVFQNNFLEKNFSAYDGNYEMFYPIKHKDKIIVLYFQDRQQYGKIGS